MNATWLDHAFVFCFAVLLPIRGATLGYRRLADLDAHATRARLRFYRQSLLLHALIIVVALSIWGIEGRDWVVLGLGAPDPARVLVALAAVFTGLVLHWLQGAYALKRHRLHGRGHDRLGKLLPLMPRTRHELDALIVLLVVAAVSEEILFRGYLLLYLTSYMPLAAAAALSVVAFAIGHAYQGLKGVVQTAIIGTVCTVLVLATGSLWPAIVLHAGLNFVSAHIGHALVRGR
jgi:membrane protease YdiL (CAAX protease family)